MILHACPYIGHMYICRTVSDFGHSCHSEISVYLPCISQALMLVETERTLVTACRILCSQNRCICTTNLAAYIYIVLMYRLMAV